MANILRKVALMALGLKSSDFISTPYGTYFTLKDNKLAELIRGEWTTPSDSKLIEYYHSMPEVFSAVYHRAFRVSQGRYAIMKKVKGGKDEPVTDNQILNTLLASPNPLQNWQEFIYEIEAYRCVTGKNYVYANVPDTLQFNYKNVNTLVNLFADTVAVRTKGNVKLLSATTIQDLIEAYDSEGLSLKPEKVLFLRFPSLEANDRKLTGKSPLLSARKELDNLSAVKEARNAVYRKGGALGFLSSNKGDESGKIALSPKEVEEVNEQYTRNYGFGKGKKTVGIVSAPLVFTKTGATIAEMQPFEETEVSAQAVYSTLLVPRSLMPKKEGATYENAKQDEISFYRNVVIPSAESICQSLSSFLGLTAMGMYIHASFDHIEVLQENKKEKAEVEKSNTDTWHKQFLSGIITLNDFRVRCGEQPIAGNKIYDKLVFDMEPDEFTKVEAIARLLKSGSGGNNPNPQADVTGAQQ